MALGDTLVIFQPEHNHPPASDYATVDIRNGHVVLDFDDSTDESALFSGVVPRHYAGGDVSLALTWAATSATTGNVQWTAAFERHEEGADDLDSDSFASAKAVTAAAAGSAGSLAYSQIAFSPSEADGIAAGEHFRIKVARDANHGADTLVGDAELLAVEFKEG